jgi:radical SAM protein with 4Fe4S-binding SPASM domain
VSELTFGLVGQDCLEEVWTSQPVLNMIRDDIPGRLTGVCGRCVMKDRCLGSCVAQNYYRSHNLLAPFWFCEKAELAGLFPASRLQTVRKGDA